MLNKETIKIMAATIYAGHIARNENITENDCINDAISISDAVDKKLVWNKDTGAFEKAKNGRY